MADAQLPEEPGQLIAYYKAFDGTLLAVNAIWKDKEDEEKRTEPEVVHEMAWKAGQAFVNHLENNPQVTVL